MPLMSGIYLGDTQRSVWDLEDESRSTNPDIADYLGYFNLKVGVVDPDGLALDTHLWWAKEGASVQVDVTYALTRLLGKKI